MPLIKPRPSQAVRASSVPTEDQPPILAMNPGLRASSLPPELENPDQISLQQSRRYSTSSSIWKWNSHHESSSSLSLTPPTPPLQHKEPRLGTLVVVVLRARHLPDKHVCSKQNVYTVIKFCGETLRTTVDVRGGQHPEWDEELRFGVWSETVHAMRSQADNDTSRVAEAKVMKVSVWEDKKGPDLLVGEGLLDVSQALRKGEFDEWIPLSREGTQRGEVFLELTYFSAGLPHITPRPFSAEFRGCVPDHIAKNMSYIVAPTSSMIAVASVMECGNTSSADTTGHHTSLPRISSTTSPASSNKHHSAGSVDGYAKLTKPRPVNLQVDDLPSISSASNRKEVPYIPGSFSDSPVDSPLPTLAAQPLQARATNDTAPPSSNNSSPLPPPIATELSEEISPSSKERWSERISTLVHSFTEKLNINHEHAEEETGSESESLSASDHTDTANSEDDDVFVPGGF